MSLVDGSFFANLVGKTRYRKINSFNLPAEFLRQLRNRGRQDLIVETGHALAANLQVKPLKAALANANACATGMLHLRRQNPFCCLFADKIDKPLFAVSMLADHALAVVIERL